MIRFSIINDDVYVARWNYFVFGPLLVVPFRANQRAAAIKREPDVSCLEQEEENKATFEFGPSPLISGNPEM